MSNACWPVPTISAHSPAIAWSSTRRRIGQPPPTVPSTCDPATATSRKTTLHWRRVISTVFSCVISTPGASASTRKRVMPSSGESASPPVRAATTRRSATCASGTNSFSPDRTKPASVAAADMAMPPASYRPPRSTWARLRTSSPAATRGKISAFCSSEPPASTAAPPNSTVAKNGPGMSDLPISSSTTTKSRKLPPLPPYCSGIRMPSQPNSAAFFHSSVACAVSSSIILRTNAVGHSASRNLRVASRSNSWSSLNPKSMFPP